MFEQKLGEAKASAIRKAKDIPEGWTKAPTREEIEEAVQEYLAKGGTITKLDSDEPYLDEYIEEEENNITSYITPSGRLITNVEEY